MEQHLKVYRNHTPACVFGYTTRPDGVIVEITKKWDGTGRRA